MCTMGPNSYYVLCTGDVACERVRRVSESPVPDSIARGPWAVCSISSYSVRRERRFLAWVLYSCIVVVLMTCSNV